MIKDGHRSVDPPILSFDDGVGFRLGDLVATDFARSWLDIWWERLTTLRWRVPLMERRYFRCTSVAPGAIWPEA